jgi:CO dehydrogenase maturation factor
MAEAYVDHVVVADMEAGLGTMSRMSEGHLDCVLVVADPTAKALEVARRAIALARERKVGQVMVIANRLRGDADLGLIQQALPGEAIYGVTRDSAVEDADRDARAPIDAAPDSPAMRALRIIAHRLLPSAN